ncbi:MAG: LemA family protein [Bacteroidota bacterium]
MLYIFIILIIAVIAIAIVVYNDLQTKAQEIREKSSNINVSISKKLSLVNQLIDVVKNYQEGEQLVQLKVSQDASTSAMMGSYQQAGTVLASVQGMAERFPNLKANEQYTNLSRNIEKCEEDIQTNRVFYNKVVKDYNTKRLKIPTIFVARAMGFSAAPYIEFDLSGATDVTSLKEFRTDDGERLQELLSGAGSKIIGVSKIIAVQAGNVGKNISDKITEKGKVDKYFYMEEGGVPKGPIPLSQIAKLVEGGSINETINVSVEGSDKWQVFSSITI